jgi:hypothetical protein
MFDSVYVQCPHCGEEVELQTKSGQCILGRYYLYNAPADVLLGIEGRNYCEKCDKPFHVMLQMITRAWIEAEDRADEEDR